MIWLRQRALTSEYSELAPASATALALGTLGAHLATEAGAQIARPRCTHRRSPSLTHSSARSLWFSTPSPNSCFLGATAPHRSHRQETLTDALGARVGCIGTSYYDFALGRLQFEFSVSSVRCPSALATIGEQALQTIGQASSLPILAHTHDARSRQVPQVALGTSLAPGPISVPKWGTPLDKKA